MRLFDSLPFLFSLALLGAAFAIGFVNLDIAAAVLLLVALGAVAVLIAAHRLRRIRGAERVALLVSGAALLYVALYVARLDVLLLFAVLLLIVGAGQSRTIGAMVGPLGAEGLAGPVASEARRTLLAIVLRLGVVLLAVFLLSALLWNAMASLNVGATADFTAFLLAALLILLLTLLVSLPE